MANKIDIYILSGFLGSGKSTLLARLLEFEQYQGRKLGVIMNEMGEKSIDSAIVPGDVTLKELLNGCICCSLQGTLSSQMKDMADTYELDAIYIESTGAAHLIEVVDACTHLSIVHNVDLKGIVTVVNAKQWLEGRMSGKLKKLLKEQVKHADAIIVNKIDTIDEIEKDGLMEGIRTINPEAVRIPAVFADIDLSRLQSIKRKHTSQEHTHEHYHLHLHTFTVSVKNPVNRIQLEKKLMEVSGQLYRAKGFVRLDETPGLHLFNYSYGVTMYERCRQQKDYTTELVFIGENLNEEQIKTTVSECQTNE
ncbi:CobW family GTP-binding protein [Alteribacillus bidgolensis]|uniref:GTPase, G3E family n=1 Tax=Alteribacillus bidgolensis TaxID=930129 RepID=A0A1G8FNC0_9BACI|nr:GTP-binding protein [Alteribacillus bidgolensis]SDH83635.1 GTPase, G3E family [Alteribacillus bidgolensis]